MITFIRYVIGLKTAETQRKTVQVSSMSLTNFFFLILSMPSMQFKRIRIDIIARTWCFNVSEHAFKLFIAKNFAKYLQGKSTVYAFIICNIIEKLTVKYQVRAINIMMSRILNAFKTQNSWQRMLTDCLCIKITIMRSKSLQSRCIIRYIICQIRS